MKNSATAKRAGFALSCLGIVCAVGLMYQLKLDVVDHWSSDICWKLNVAALILLPLISGSLFQYANKLDKEQK